MLKRWFYLLMSVPILYTQSSDFESNRDSILLSWSSFLDQKGIKKKSGILVFYAKKNCLACTELKAWLDFYMVPHIYLECSPILPPLMPKFRDLVSLRGFICKDRKNKLKGRIFLSPSFPQLEYASYDLDKDRYSWQIQAGNTKTLRDFVEKIVVENVSGFPGFEHGVLGDK